MTTDTIPDLWPTAALKVDVRTPVAILRTQATRLGQRTQGLLIGEVTITTGENNQVVLGLEVIVPALNNYRYRLLSVQHAQDAIFPAKVSANGFKIDVTEFGMLLQNSRTVTKHVNTKTAYSEGDFIDIVHEALQAPETTALMQSLIVRSNEEKSASPLQEVDDENEEGIEP